MTGETIIEFRGVEKALGESFPLRINEFRFREHERMVIELGTAFVSFAAARL